MQNEVFYTNLKSVYNCLEDAESKEIFKSSLLYWCTGEVKSFKEPINRKFEAKGKKYFLDQLEQGAMGEIVLFGAGLGAQIILDFFQELHIKVKYCVDNDSKKWGTTCRDIPVVSPEQLQQDKEVYVIISSPSPCYSKDMFEQVREMGHKDTQILLASEVLGEIYCDTDILTLTSDDVLVDGGCFDGTDTIEINALVKGGIKKVYAFEPDKTNFESCQENLKDLDNVELINTGIYSYSGTIYFNSDMSWSSAVCEEGQTSVQVDKIDDIGDDVTFIKMDIEGSELEALKGAQNNIKNNKPKMAISIYHKPEDLFEIPLFLKELVPEYKFYLRQYTFTYVDCVLYATV